MKVNVFMTFLKKCNDVLLTNFIDYFARLFFLFAFEYGFINSKTAANHR